MKPSKTVTLSCAAGSALLGTSCYMVSQPVPGTAADAACRSAGGGSPAVIETNQEMVSLRGACIKWRPYLFAASY